MSRNQAPDHRDPRAIAGLTQRLERKARDQAAELARLPIDERPAARAKIQSQHA